MLTDLRRKTGMESGGPRDRRAGVPSNAFGRSRFRDHTDPGPCPMIANFRAEPFAYDGAVVPGHSIAARSPGSSAVTVYPSP